MKKLYKSALFLVNICTTLYVNAQTVPSLNSFASASAVLYLDFDGHTVSGTSWNIQGNFNCKPSGLNNTQITEVFNRVSEDFRPFNINVTTSETKFMQAHANKRIRIIITSSHEWYGSGAGGVAFLHSFVWDDNTPAFVFSALFNYSVKNIAESVSHEAGHTLGLKHQSAYTGNCVKISDYNWGQGAGEIGWAPIMGASYNQNLTLWHNGPNSNGCNNLQSDLDIISNEINGFGFRTDDHANSFLDAIAVSFNNDQFTISGIIERTDDKDLFKFILPQDGRFRLNAVPYNTGTGNAGSDLDMQVTLLDSSNNLLGTYNPGMLLSSVIDTFLTGGIFFIRVEGKGNMYAPEYASLGSYSLQGIFSSETITSTRRIELSGQMNNDLHQLKWQMDINEPVYMQSIEVSEDGRNFYQLDIAASNERAYQYRPKENRPLQYRIHIILMNNKDYYSNSITIRLAAHSKPQLVGNIISGKNISVSSPGNFNYQILDQGGRMITKGSITSGYNNISLGGLSYGMYIIRFNNNEKTWIEKFVKN